MVGTCRTSLAAERHIARGRGHALLVAGLCISLAALGCGFRQEGEKRPNILIAVFDACRPDKMGCYGFDRPATEAIDRLAGDPDSIVFERHYVQSNWTKPSTASLFTGLLLHQHRVSGGSFGGMGHEWFSVLPDEFQTLAEDFQKAGYFTFSVTSNPHLDPRFGFDQGFDTYSMRRPGDQKLYQEALRLAGKTRGPFLGYVHFNGCHYPYPPFMRDEEYFSTYGFSYDEPARVAAGIDFSDASISEAVNRRGLTLEADDVRFLNLVYESRLRRMDRKVVQPLIEGLHDKGLYDETLIVLTADHGEELYDHRGYAHGHALWEEVIRVPLIIKFTQGDRPEELGSTWTGLSRAIDLYPSLAAAAGLDRPDGIVGQNLFQGADIQLALADGLNQDDDLAIVMGDEKLIWDPGTPFFLPSAGRLVTTPYSLLFDLKDDPRETRDLAVARPESVLARRMAVRRLWQELPQPRTSYGDVEAQPLSPKAVETLRSLGYVE